MATPRKRGATKAAPGKEVAVRKTTSIADVQAEMAREIEKMKERVGSAGGNSISIRDKVFTFPDGSVSQDPIEVIILDFVSRNLLYEGKWDPKNPQPPVCFAMGREIASMAPIAASPDKQHDNCADCPMNQFGSDGDGKACKNTRLLAVTIPGFEDMDDAPIYTLSVPPTAIKAFDAHVQTILTMFQAPPIRVVTKIAFHPEKQYATLLFSTAGENPEFAQHWSLRPKAEPMLTAEPDFTLNGGEKKKPARGRRTRR